MSEIYDMAGHLIRRLNQISLAIFSERMAALGEDLTSVQYAALTVVQENPGIDQAGLAGAIAYDKATIGGVVDRLAGKGLLIRARSERDRRARALTITDRGAALLGRVRPTVHALQSDILAGLNDAERDQIMCLLARTTEAGNSHSRAPLKRRPAPQPTAAAAAAAAAAAE